MFFPAGGGNYQKKTTEMIEMKKTIWITIASFVLIFALTACGGTDDTYRPCDHVAYQITNAVGEIYVFPDAAAGPNILSVNEGDQLALGSGNFIIYREDITEGIIYLFSETLAKEGIRVTAYVCDKNIGFDVDYFPLQTFDELMLMQQYVDWNAWSGVFHERFLYIDESFTAISVGVVRQETNELMSVPVGLTIPHNEGWHMPDDQQSMEGVLTTFHVPTSEVSGAVSRIQYVPQPGWELKNTINETASDGSQFVIFVVSPTVSVMDLTPFGYKGPITRLLTKAISLTDGKAIPLNGLLVAGNERSLGGETRIVLEIPINPYDVNGTTNFLTSSEALVNNDYVQATSTSGFHWEFNVMEGTLKYYFEDAD